MRAFEFRGRRYESDESGFPHDSQKWDEDFAREAAVGTGIAGSLSEFHWGVISLIRDRLAVTGKCPRVRDIRRAQHLHIACLKRLFPTGYLRGAYRLADVACGDWEIYRSSFPKNRPTKVSSLLRRATYRVDILGFLVDPSEWDEGYAISRAGEMKMVQELTEVHWKIIGFLRACFLRDGKIPTVGDTCEANGISTEDIERLFPDGYRHGAVKIAGLPSR